MSEAVAATTSNRANQQALRAIVIQVRKDKTVPIGKDNTAPLGEGEPGHSQALPNDPFDALSKAGQVVEPPFDLLTLAMLNEHNSELGQCIDAMETNIDGFGHRLVSRVKIGKEEVKELNGDEKKLPKSIEAERIRLENFFMYAALKDSFTAFRRKLRRDLESTGNAYMEVIRNASGQIQGFTHIPSYQMRLGRMEDEDVEVDMPILELQENGAVAVTKVKVWTRFRRFVQSRFTQFRNLSTVGGAKVRWFKEFGDPRHYNNETGEMLDEEKLKITPPARRSNEMIHIKLYSARTPYGLPRYIGNLLSIFGDRAAEEINYVTFRNNNIPSMVVMVSNGQLTEGSVKRIEDFVESQIQGSDNYSKFLILEAESALEGEDGNQIKMEIKPLVKEQHKDALFQVYSQNNQDKVRRAFRLPPIFVGRAEDYTRATADASRRLADEQIFAPERDEFDNLINRIIFPAMGVVYHKFKSNTPNTTDNQELVQILSNAEKTGGITPRIARNMLEDILGRDLPPFPKDFPADVPFSMTMAEAVKNLANPGEPGQQLTAIKAITKALYGEDAEAAADGGEDPIADHLVALNKRLDKRWREEVTKNDELVAENDELKATHTE